MRCWGRAGGLKDSSMAGSSSSWWRVAQSCALPSTTNLSGIATTGLFQEFLQRQLGKQYAAVEIAELHWRAASWLEVAVVA
jgi:hypothetical protein